MSLPLSTNVSVWMLHRDLGRAPRYALPDGYHMRFYRDGDVATWVSIQQAAEPFILPTSATFAEYLPGETDHLAQRVMFLVDPAGVDIGTITAWNDAALLGRDIGCIHWVAIVPQAQGRGLAKPMLSVACNVLLALGYSEAYLETGTGRIPALNLYLHFGFKPFIRAEADRDAWRVVLPHLKGVIVE